MIGHGMKDIGYVRYVTQLTYKVKKMKIHRLDAHDRLEHLQKDQSHVIAKGCEDCLKKNSLSLAIQDRCHYVYIFAHPRTADDGVNKRLLWQPRLTKPKAQTNSYLFRATSKTDIVELCWFIPPRELWGQFKKGMVTESADVIWSIDQFTNNREKLEEPFPDDVTEERFKAIMYDIAKCMDEEKHMKKLYPLIEEPYEAKMD